MSDINVNVLAHKLMKGEQVVITLSPDILSELLDEYVRMYSIGEVEALVHIVEDLKTEPEEIVKVIDGDIMKRLEADAAKCNLLKDKSKARKLTAFLSKE